MKTRKRTPVLERMRRRTVETPAPKDAPVEGPCWIWQGAVDRHGYGQIGVGGRTEGHGYVHRVGYERLVEPISADKHIDHLCRMPRCWNPAHLEPVTQRVNTLRGVSLAAQNAQKTHCIAGHDLADPENVYHPPKSPNTRECRPCRREYMREYRLRNQQKRKHP